MAVLRLISAASTMAAAAESLLTVVRSRSASSSVSGAVMVSVLRLPSQLDRKSVV